MAKRDKIFLDTNFYIDVVNRKSKIYESLSSHLLYISPVSISILFYLYKLKVPNKKYNSIKNKFGIIPLTKTIINRSLEGPTADVEDNIQLHSAADADCDILLTNDKKLLKLSFFGKVKILSSL